MASETPQRAFTVARKPIANATSKETLSEDSSISPIQSPVDEKDENTLEKTNPYIFDSPGPHPATVSPVNTPQPSTRYPHTTSPQISFQQWNRSLKQKATAFLDKLPISRRIFFISLLAGLIFILALSIGLGAGLNKNNKSSQNLPLPTDTTPHTGDLTYYAPGLGACGITSSDSDEIVAISHETFDAASKGNPNPNANPLCGLMLRATRFNTATNKQVSVDLKVVDRCTGCKPSDLDTTTSVFERMAPIESGRVVVTWAWLEKVPGIAD